MSDKTKKTISVDQRAGTVLKSCVGDVKKHLKVTTKKWRTNDDGVHQLRISLRRTLACLDLFSKQFSGAEETRWLHKTAKGLLKAAGKARDLDVLLAREIPGPEKARQQLRKAWKRKRKECQKPLDRAHKSLIEDGKLQTKSRSILKALTSKRGKALDHDASKENDWRSGQLNRRVRVLMNKCPDESHLRGMHSFRVSAKQLRYVTELLHELHPSNDTEQLLELLSDVQKKLGHLQDEAVAARSVARLSSKVSRKQGRNLQNVSNSTLGAAESKALQLSSWLNEEIKPELERLSRGLEKVVPAIPAVAKKRRSKKRETAAT